MSAKILISWQGRSDNIVSLNEFRPDELVVFLPQLGNQLLLPLPAELLNESQWILRLEAMQVRDGTGICSWS